MLLENYIEQHSNIRKQISIIDNLVKKGNLQADAFEISTNISRLAGIIKIHLSSEDRYLYPDMINGDDEEAGKMAKEYQIEMGSLLEVFTEFKDKYNTKAKILDAVDQFIPEYRKIVKKLDERMNKEEKGLYKFIN